MLKALQVSLRRTGWRSVCFPARRLPAAASGWALTRQLCSKPGRFRRPALSCTVDPNLEEQFVFLDCTEEDPHQEEEDLVLHQIQQQQQQQTSQQQQQISGVKQLRSLERQLQAARGVSLQEADPDSLIQFEDVDFPLDPSLVASKKKKKKERTGEHKIFGTPDVDEPVSNTCCSGCGAILHCTATSVPGYLPSEKYKVLLQDERLQGATCQRCYLLTHHHKALNLQLSKDQYRAVVEQVRPLKALVLLIVDLMDVPDSIIPDLPELVGANKHVVVLGNKIDLLPADSHNYRQRIRRQLAQYCQDAGFGDQVTNVHLISAKTGYGIESLISSLQQSLKYKGDVYLVGSANAGKSTLFNALLESDYCKSKGSDVIHKATISPWPGTTLNLLKFPIINPTPYRLFRRQERLNEASQQTESDLSPEELKRLQHFSRQGYLVGRVGRTFRTQAVSRQKEIEFDADSLAFGENEDAEMVPASSKSPEEFTYNELKDAHWLFDTPGIMKEHDLLNLLNEQEVKLVVPSQAIVPRTFVLKPGMTLFVGAVARIDYLEGGKSCWFSVLASSRVPVHVTNLEKADSIYEKHAGDVLLGVPLGGSERVKEFPALVSQEIRLEGRGYMEAAADITLSSAGWVAVTAVDGEPLQLRLHGPEVAGFGLRTPPLLPRIVSLKGERIRKSVAYKVVKPVGLLDYGLSAAGAERLRVKPKKKKKK